MVNLVNQCVDNAQKTYLKTTTVAGLMRKMDIIQIPRF